MLILSRKIDEQIVIGDDIRVTITKISGGRVRIAVDAPRDVSIRRGELLDGNPRRKAGDAQGNADAASLHVAAYHA